MIRRVRLTESDLHRIVKESVSRILNEANVFDPRTGEYVSVHGNGQYDWDKMAGIRRHYKRQASDDVNRYYTDWCDLDDKIEQGKDNGMEQAKLDNLRQQKKSARTNYKNMENIADKHEKAEDRNSANYYQMARQELKKFRR